MIPATGDNASPLLIMGTGPGTTLVMQTPGSTLFSVNSAFTAFQDLTVVDGSEEETSAGTAFHFLSGDGSKGYKLFRVSIVDFPNAILIDNKALAVNVLACTISYDSSYSGVACTAIKTSGAETNIEQCSLTFGVSGGDAAYTGIDIIGSSYARVTDTQVSGFGTGIMLGAEGVGTARGAIFTGLDVDALGACVYINGPAYDVCFANCSFAPTNAESPGATGVIVGTSGGENSDYDTIRFTACTVEGFGTYGHEVLCGQNLQVNGGSYSGNGTAGIAVVGDAAEVQITGANCIGTAGTATQEFGIYIAGGQDVQVVGVNCSGNGVAGIQISGSAIQDVRIVGVSCENDVLGGSSQEYGVYVEGASGVLIDGCTLTGNASYAVYLTSVENVTVSACDVYSSSTGAKGIFVGGSAEAGATDYVFIRGCNGALYANYTTFLAVTGEVSNLEVTDCAGYNDLGDTILAVGTSAPSGTFSGLIYTYFGPTAFYVVAATGTVVTIDGQNTHLSSGGFTLAPGETAEISLGIVTHFLMVGK
jgi:parallel beta-helix repeat protein